MILQRTQIPTLLAAHKVLQGEFDPATRYTIGRNTAHLTRAQREVAAMQHKLAQKHAPAGKPEVTGDDAEFDAFSKEFFAWLDTPVEVDVRVLKLESLNLGVNKIPNGAIEALDPILDLTETVHRSGYLQADEPVVTGTAGNASVSINGIDSPPGSVQS